jgi:hypothetical protein
LVLRTATNIVACRRPNGLRGATCWLGAQVAVSTFGLEAGMGFRWLFHFPKLHDPARAACLLSHYTDRGFDHVELGGAVEVNRTTPAGQNCYPHHSAGVDKSADEP